MIGFLTTHVLDTAKGCPAPGIKIELFCHKDGVVSKVCEVITNIDGRTDNPILPQKEFQIGYYELVFHVGPYLRATGQVASEPMFLDQVPIRFGMSQDGHYHVPLLLSAHGYSTYRGS
jgi:5-hydroxyisourate hydrolase